MLENFIFTDSMTRPARSAVTANRIFERTNKKKNIISNNATQYLSNNMLLHSAKGENKYPMQMQINRIEMSGEPKKK